MKSARDGEAACGQGGQRRGVIDERFRKRERITRSFEIQRLQRSGRRRSTEHFVVLTAANDLGFSRLGVIASRKTGKAVRRNRIKRLAREFFRKNKALIGAGLDILIIARKGAHLLSFREAEEELKRCFGRRGSK